MMTPEQRQPWQRLEVASRRPVGPGSRHPDECPKLTLRGAAFAIPPRGLRVVPEFGPQGVSVSVAGTRDWPEADNLLRLAPIRPEEVCPQCGRALRASLRTGADDDIAFLTACFALAGRLLDEQYELTPSQKAELLAFPSNEVPAWIAQLLQWCQGSGPEGSGG
jgi:hypothetical protein